MKITAFLLLVGCLQLSARSAGQTVTLSVKDAPMKEVFKEIQKQTGLNILVDESILEKAGKVTLDVHNMPVEQVLNLCFLNQSLEYVIENGAIAIKQKLQTPNDLTTATPQNPPHDIEGRIINAQGEPLANASVVITRTGKGDVADANGRFKLKGVNADDEIQISYTGYTAQTIKAGDRANIIVTLIVANDELDRVVMQAYGKTSQRLSTGDIAKVTAEEIERQPVMNPLLALQGKVPGLVVSQTNGFASAPIKVELRGRNSINSAFTSDPLYIIDGVPLTVLELTPSSNYASGSTGFLQNGATTPAGGQSPLFSINPSDIESIEVLKDADATAIYGSRAANGVILITTKKGKAGKTRFDLNITEGVSKETRFFVMMNTQQYLQMRREAFKNDGIAITLANGAYDLLQWDTTRYTDWQKVLYGGTGSTYNIQAGLTGGNAQTSFRIGAGYNHTTNILTVSGGDQKASGSISLSHASLNHKFNISLSNNYSFTKSDMINLPGSITLPPNAPPIYDSFGNLNYAGWGGQNTDARNLYPFSTLKHPYTSKTSFLTSSLNLAYQPLKELQLTTNIGYNDAQVNQQQFSLLASYDPLTITASSGTSFFGYNSNKNWIVEPQANYGVFINKGKLDILVGGSLQQTNTVGSFVNGTGYTSDNLIRSLANSSKQTGFDNQGEYRYAALFGRISYNWENKYLLNFNARRDGSSRFGPGKQFGNFGSIGAAWIFSDESWIKNKLKFLSYGKLRGSYGTTGSDAQQDYLYLTQWTAIGGQPYTGVSVLRPTLHANPNFQWQINKKLEGAIDLGLLKDRIHFSVSWYQNRCGNQLLRIPLPNLTGFPTVYANWPAVVQNSGWEFSTNIEIIRLKNFSWGITFNQGINHNKLVSFPDLSKNSAYLNNVFINQPLNSVYVYHYLGVDPQTGDPAFEDRNHDGVIQNTFGSVTGDTYPLNLSPKFSGGLGMNFNYKTLSVNLTLDIRKQLGQNAYYTSTSVSTPGALGNQPAFLFDSHWQKPGDVVIFPRFTTQSGGSGGFSNFNLPSDVLYTDASFIRLSNLSILYSLPIRWVKKAGLQACSISLNTNNIFTITKYKGIDPETQSFGSLPPARTIVGGINFSF